MNAYKQCMHMITLLEKIAASVLLVFVTGLTFANVVVRKLAEVMHIQPFAWTEELVINLFVLLIMIGCALCAQEGSLISLSLIFDMLKVRGRKIFMTIITAANLAFWVVLLHSGWQKVLSQMKSGKLTSSLGWNEWVFTIFLPIGAALLILHTIEYYLDVLRGEAACVKLKEEKGGTEA